MRILRSSLQIILKLCNFFLAVGGIAMVAFGFVMLNEWKSAQDTPSMTTSVAVHFRDASLSLLQMPSVASQLGRKAMVGDATIHLPAPWFIYAFLAAGVIICLVTFTGAVAAEVNSSCCLTTYQFGVAFMLAIQLLLAGYLFFNKSWDKSIPADPTGELDKLRELITQNITILKWFGLAILVLQVVAIVLSMTLRAMHDHERLDELTRRRAEALLSEEHQQQQQQQQQAFNEFLEKQKEAGGLAHEGRTKESREPYFGTTS